MNFLFGLFRFLTWGNLISLGLLGLVILLAGLASMVLGDASVMFPVLTFMLMLFTIAMHNIKCLRLQRVLRQPGSDLPQGFSVQMILLSVLAFVYGIYVINLLVQMNFLSLDDIIQAGNFQDPPKETGYTKYDMARMSRNIANFLMGTHGVAIVTNCVLSSFFLNKWKKDREQAENKEQFFDV